MPELQNNLIKKVIESDENDTEAHSGGQQG